MENEVNILGNGKDQGRKIQLVLRWEDLVQIPKWTSKKGDVYVTLDVLPRKVVSEWGHTHLVIEHKKFEKQKESSN